MQTLSAPFDVRNATAARWAVYYAPPAASALWRFGCDWLGRDAETGAPCVPDLPPGLDAQAVHALTAAARRYGFHATLKAPFALARGSTGLDMIAACRAFAARHAPFSLGALAVAEISGFLALVPAAAGAELREFAFACVRGFDDLRAPAGEAERARRLAQPLSARQRELLTAWGYPYVDEEFRFHMTLTDRLEPAQRDRLLPWLRERHAALNTGAVELDAIALFVEPAAGADFRLVERFALGQ